MNLLALLWVQVNPESVSWWLPSGTARDIIWTAVAALNLALLLWVVYKLLVSFKVPHQIRGRSVDIRTRIESAERSHQEAQQRLAALETRIAQLPAEIAAIEAEAEREAAEEYKRVVAESQRESERILHLGKMEIEAVTKLAQKELKSLAASLAVDLATKRIEERLTAEMDEEVVRHALAAMAVSGGRTH
ncbi:MAG TPA: ATP synthase F0 subunit B [Terriglobales bacterium]|nr:ATP synthase F0 subunit B [Terriglobales bacterium]